jgi:hypothetical protein
MIALPNFLIIKTINIFSFKEKSVFSIALNSEIELDETIVLDKNKVIFNKDNYFC